MALRTDLDQASAHLTLTTGANPSAGRVARAGVGEASARERRCQRGRCPEPGSNHEGPHKITRRNDWEVPLDNHNNLRRPFDPAFADPRRLALGGFLAGYSGLTRHAYELDLRQFLVWCDNHELDLFVVRRAGIEAFARDLDDRRRARATVARRLCTVTSFYRYAEEEGMLAHSPAVHVRRPRIDYESHATGLDRDRKSVV